MNVDEFWPQVLIFFAQAILNPVPGLGVSQKQLLECVYSANVFGSSLQGLLKRTHNVEMHEFWSMQSFFSGPCLSIQAALRATAGQHVSQPDRCGCMRPRAVCQPLNDEDTTCKVGCAETSFSKSLQVKMRVPMHNWRLSMRTATYCWWTLSRGPSKGRAWKSLTLVEYYATKTSAGAAPMTFLSPQFAFHGSAPHCNVELNVAAARLFLLQTHAFQALSPTKLVAAAERRNPVAKVCVEPSCSLGSHLVYV